MEPPSGRTEMACRTAFSARVCSEKGGTSKWMDSGSICEIHFEAVLIAKLLEGDVLAREVVLFGEFHHLAAVLFERVAQHVAQTLDGAFGLRWGEISPERSECEER